MRFMVLVKSDPDIEAGNMQGAEELFTEMAKYNEELVKAGVMLAGEGLHPSSQGVRVCFDGDKPTVLDGPFAEARELVAGFWLWEVSSLEEAVEWVKRAPFDGGVLEIRRVQEAEDFGDAVPAEVHEKEQRMREQLAQR